MTIRKYIFVAAFLTLSLLLYSCKDSPKGSHDRPLPPHIGVWAGVDPSNVKGTVTFKEDGTGSMEFADNIYEFNYVFDYSRKPVWLDLIYSREGKPFRAKLVVKFENENRFQWFTFFTETRPDAFPEKDSEGVMVLTKVDPFAKA